MAEQIPGASGKENVTIRLQDCSVRILPQFGGKIASIQIEGRELLQTPLAPIAPRTHTMSFDESDASGWDECLPSVAACTVPTSKCPRNIPDHGDLWRVEWEVVSHNEHSAIMEARCFSLPLKLRRTIELTEIDKGWQLGLHYELANTGDFAVPWSWAAHPLFSVEKGDRIVLPDTIHELKLEGSGADRLGAGPTVNWPKAKLANGGEADLSVAQGPEAGIGDKLFAGPVEVSENWCVLERPSAGVKIRVRFDPAATPYLGLWICYGGWPDRSGPKQYCVAMEPSTAPVDSLARTGMWSQLQPGQTFQWPMFVELERL